MRETVCSQMKRFFPSKMVCCLGTIFGQIFSPLKNVKPFHGLFIFLIFIWFLIVYFSSYWNYSVQSLRRPFIWNPLWNHHLRRMQGNLYLSRLSNERLNSRPFLLHFPPLSQSAAPNYVSRIFDQSQQWKVFRAWFSRWCTYLKLNNFNHN